MRKLTSWIAPLVLLLAAAALAPALAGEAPAAPAAVKAPALCPAAATAHAQPAAPLPGLTPDPLFAAICTVGCVNTSCRRDSDCTAAPGGTCVFACPKVGCCTYP